MVFDFIQFWLDGRPGNEHFWISHKISDLLTPLTPLGVHLQWFETDLSYTSYSAFLEIAHPRTYIEWDWPLLPFPSTTTTLVGGRDPQWKHYYSYLLSTTLHSLPPLLTKYLSGRKQTRWECNYTFAQSICTHYFKISGGPDIF